MKKRLIILVGLFGLILVWLSDAVNAQRQMEKLDRGVVAYKTGDPVLISWRIFGNEYYGVSYNVYRGSTKLNSSPITGPSYYVDNDNIYDSTYTVTAIVNGVEQPSSSPAPVWDQNYIDIPLQRPADGTNPSGSYSYSPNDASVGDLDGDGQYEIVLKWDPSNSKDNSYSGYTGNVILDGYELDGTHMWRIDLGINIRAGAHYTQFMVYDLDGDGKAEIACKTAPGTRDASGNYLKLGPASGADHTADYRNTSGYILSGPEYFTVFDGETGIELATAEYDPPRGSPASWGDTYGNRVDRFLACIAYLDGIRPSVVMCRGYYRSRDGNSGRTVLAAWDYRDGLLTKRWTFNADMKGENANYTGQGNHNLSVADVDNDGKDEIIYGSCTIDDDGTGLYTTGLGHGDALHVSDLDPDRPGLEVFAPHENKKDGATFRDAATGTIIWQKPKADDVGRALAADVLPGNKGSECWASSGLGMYSCKGKYVGTIPSINFAIWWDSDDQRELLDHNWNSSSGIGIPTIKKYNGGVLLTASGTYSNNYTKGNPCLQADILGDWHEEVIFRHSNSSALRMYLTKSGTYTRMYTLMHDPVYRLGIAWQNVAYNQPPHTGFYFGDGREAPPPPVSSGKLKWNNGTTWDIQTSKNWIVNDTSAFYNDGDNVLFDMSGSSASEIELEDTLKPKMVTVHSSTDYIFEGTGTLSGLMRLIKAGPGTLTVNTDNDYTGETSVWNGEFIINGNLSQSHVRLYTYAGIGGKGTFGKGVSMPYGGSFSVSSHGEADTLVINDSLHINNNARFFIDLSDDISGVSKTNDILLINGDLMLPGLVTININMLDGKLGVGKYTLIRCTGDFEGSIDGITMEGLLGVPYELTMTDSTLILEAFYIRPPSSIVWKGDQSDIWDQVATLNWLNNDSADWFVKNDTVIFDDSGSSATTIQLVSSLPVGEMVVNSSVDYAFKGTGSISGEGKLVKTGSGTLTLSGSNEYTGGTSVDNGTLMITNISGTATGEGVVNMNNGAVLSGIGVIGGLVNINEGAMISTVDNALGELTIDNDLTLMTGAHLDIDVNSNDNKSDILSVAGHLHLDGTLHMTDIVGGPYLRYDYFKFLDAQNITGMFSDIVPESPGENLKWDTTLIRSQGAIRILSITGVDEPEIEQFAHIYPNPADNHLTIYFSESPEKVLVELSDLSGRIISSSTVKYPTNVEFDLSAVASGVYFIRIQTDSHTFIRKIIKN